MSVNNNHHENETQVIESEFNKLNIPDEDSNPINTNRINCSYCSKPFFEELWCKDCDLFRMIEGWTSGNLNIDKFIKDIIYNAGEDYESLIEWVPFDRFTDIEQIGEGGFSKVYIATWIDGKSKFIRQDDGSWKKRKPRPMEVALKKLNGSQNISAEYLNEVYILYYIYIDFFKF